MIMVIFENLMRSNSKLGKMSLRKLISMDEVKSSLARMSFTWIAVSDPSMYLKVEIGEKLSSKRMMTSLRTRHFFNQ